MNKSILAIALTSIMASGAAFASEIKTDAYVGAELGGNFLVGEEDSQGDGTFAFDNMVKVGAELSKEVKPGVSAFVGTEVRFGMAGVDSDWTEGKYEGSSTEIHRFTVGADTMAGRTEFGILEGEADELDGFADLSMEHGLNADFGAAINGQNTLQHKYENDKFTASASFDFDEDAFLIGGTAKVMPNLEVGAAYVDGGDVDSQAYTLGAVYSLQKIDLAAKYTSLEGDDVEESTGYALSGSYSLSEKVKLAASYNDVDYDDAASEDDDFFTVGTSYQLSKNVELVADYKFASESDDQFFVRANIDF